MRASALLPVVTLGLLTARPPDRLSAQTRPRQATDYCKMTFVGDPVLSPDGRRAAFTVTTIVEEKDRRHSEIWMVPTDGSTHPYRFTSPSFEASAPTWSPDGALLAFTSHREGSEDDVWFLRTGPFGDQVGAEASNDGLVKRYGCVEPSVGTIQISLCRRSFSSTMVVTVNAARRPSGESTGSPTNVIL